MLWHDDTVVSSSGLKPALNTKRNDLVSTQINFGHFWGSLQSKSLDWYKQNKEEKNLAN